MRKIKTAALLSLCFLIPAALSLAVFAAMGMAPFGSKSILIMDMSGQYVEFLCGLKTGAVYFSWAKALGGNYIGVFAYYVSSPLSFLTLLCPNADMPIAVLFLTVLKLGLSGLTFGIFLLCRFRKTGLALVIFSMFYGLMSYSIAYFMCITWLDGVIWLPILILGTERIFEGKGFALFAVAALVSFLSTYYITYMTCIFAALYLISRIVEEKLPRKKIFRCAWDFALGGVLAAALGSFFLLPTLESLFQGRIGALAMDYSGFFNFSPLDLLSKFLPGSYDSITNNSAPFIYCGAVPLILFVVFFCLKKIPLRGKLTAGAFALFLLLSFWLSPLDKVWHVFHYPNWFPYRYAFVFSFLVLLTAYRAYLELHFDRKLVLCFVLVLCSAEMGYNAIAILRGLDKEFRFESYASYHDYKEMVAPLLDAVSRDKDGFYRTDATFERTKNEPIAFGYNGITHYSSAFNRDLNRFLSKLGFAQSYIWSSYFGSTPVTDALFDVRYILSQGEVSQDYKTVATNGTAILYQNPFAAPAGIAVSRETLDHFEYGENSYESQNNLIRALTGEQDSCFVPVTVEKSFKTDSFEYEFISDGQPVYASFTGTEHNGWLIVNGTYVTNLFTDETNCIHYLGTYEAGRTVTVSVYTPGDVSAKFYALDEAAYKQAAGTLIHNGLRDVKAGKNSLSGTVDSKEGDVLFTTIPYDSGWTAQVDGHKAEIGKFAGSLMTVTLPAGTHRVELIYTAPGLIPGIAISCCAVLALAFLLFYRRGLFSRRPRQGRGAEKEKEAEPLMR